MNADNSNTIYINGTKYTKSTECQSIESSIKTNDITINNISSYTLFVVTTCIICFIITSLSFDGKYIKFFYGIFKIIIIIFTILAVLSWLYYIYCYVSQ